MPDADDRWSSIELHGHACHVFTPRNLNPHRYVLVYLHGVHLESLHDKREFLDQFEHYGFPVVCPQCGPTWWSDRVTPVFDPVISPYQYVTQHVRNYVQQRWSSGPPSIGLFGTSMGGQGALRIAYRLPHLFPVVAAIAPAIDFQHRLDEDDEILIEMYGDRETARQDTATLHVHPLNWPRNQFFCCDPADSRWFESAERLAMKLRALGVPFESDLNTTAGGHGFRYYRAMAEPTLRFLFERLEQERKRVA
ncbi:MAG: alpha/beta hydrolase-fold protein [Pirellulaceae bacterium]|nr:prolyl oligopeptidase family serine peptidase [Planctomycetales bacterium]